MKTGEYIILCNIADTTAAAGPARRGSAPASILRSIAIFSVAIALVVFGFR